MAADLNKAASSIAQSLEAQYQSQAGVNLDEEGVELIRYQQAHQAAARILSVALEMLDTILKL